MESSVLKFTVEVGPKGLAGILFPLLAAGGLWAVAHRPGDSRCARWLQAALGGMPARSSRSYTLIGAMVLSKA